MLDRKTEAVSSPPPADQISAVAKAFAHPVRVRIISFLLSRPGCIGGDIVDQVGLAQSTVSEHLRILKDAGVVRGTIDHPRICYALDPAALSPLRDMIAAIEARPPESDSTCRPQ
ncbi:MAG: winged helix-turn-helix transcriptional regulator [Loktanella sp.]|nr:winged helix-turn-helix transcriptional regulator [Loktanella sp.]